MKVFKGFIVVMAIVGMVLTSGVLAEEVTYEETVSESSKENTVSPWLSQLIGKKINVITSAAGKTGPYGRISYERRNLKLIAVEDKGIIVELSNKVERFYSYGQIVFVEKSG